jgi:hypothetical protein
MEDSTTSTDGNCQVCIMLLRTKPSQYLHLHSSHPSEPRHIPCYTVPITVSSFDKYL